MNTLLLLTTCLLLAGCSVLGNRTASEPPYRVEKAEKPFEIRRYDAMTIAETVLEGSSYQAAGSRGFQRLAGYIFGRNRSKTSIAMTAPVLQERTGEKLPMTAPVLQERQAGGWKMAFVLPEGFTPENAPEPIDPTITLRELPARTIAVVSFTGMHSSRNLESYARDLDTWLRKEGYTALSTPQFAAYDPPWTLPFLRRNEVHREVRMEAR